MPAGLAYLYQARLKDEEENPSVESGPVNPDQAGRGNLGMKQPRRYGGAEHTRDQNEDKQ